MTSNDSRDQREAELRAYYAQEVDHRASNTLDHRRVEARTSFTELLRREARETIVEIGCGVGRDGTAFDEAGLTYTGVDLTPESVEYCRSQGLTVKVASALELPFPDDSFEAGWTMSTLMHLAHDDLAPAVGECARVLRSGSPLAVGIWGSPEPDVRTVTTGFGDRYFATIDDARLQAALRTVGVIEEFRTWGDEAATNRHYQWAVVRIG